MTTKTLAELRAEPHLSVSQMKAFLQCPRKYHLQYIDRVTPTFRPIALAFGTAWHAAIGHHLENSTHDQLVPRDEVRTVFRYELETAVAKDDVPVLFDEKEDLPSCLAMGMKMLDVFLDRLQLPQKVVGVEMPFSLELADPVDGTILPVPLIGALDAIVMEGDLPVGWELKTGKKKFSDDVLEFDLQATAYAMAASAFGYDELDIVLLLATKTKVPDVQIERLHRYRGDRNDLSATAASMLRAVAAGVDHPVRGWQCRGCAVAHACR